MKYLLSVISLIACINIQQSDPDPFTAISVETFQSLQKKKSDLIILDVRTPEETSKGKIKGAIIIDLLSKDFIERVQHLDKSKPVLVYCASGGRSSNAMDEMRELGFSEVYNLKGGIEAWKKKGLPVMK